MNHTFGVSMGHAVTDLEKQFKTIIQAQLTHPTEGIHRWSFKIFHGEKGFFSRCRPGMHHPGNVGVVHFFEYTDFGLKPQQRVVGDQAGPHYLQGHQRFSVWGFRQVNRSHAAFSQAIQNTVGAHSLGLSCGGRTGASQDGKTLGQHGRFQEIVALFRSLQQRF